jgi:hypothetical protein
MLDGAIMTATDKKMRLWKDDEKKHFWAYIRSWNAYICQYHFDMFIEPMELNIFHSLDEGLFWGYHEEIILRGMDHPISLLATKGKWYDSIAIGAKRFDYRKGIHDIRVGDMVQFDEADEDGNKTGINCVACVNHVLHSSDAPPHFGWDGREFTIIQFDVLHIGGNS